MNPYQQRQFYSGPPLPRINTQMPSSSPSIVSDSTSDCDSNVCTPNNSRASSVNHTVHERRDSRMSNTARVTKRAQRVLPTPVTGGTEQRSKDKKTAKEKLNRLNQAAVIWQAEDQMQFYFGWAKNEQSGGNGNGAGLTGGKITVQRGELATFRYLVHEARIAAIRQGRLAEWEAQMQQIADEGTEEGCPTHKGSFLESPDRDCAHADTKAKECITHGHPDWRVCRKERAEQTFRRNEAAYLRQLGITPEQARYGGQQQQKPSAGSRRHSRHA